jgi:hypothetical protein
MSPRWRPNVRLWDSSFQQALVVVVYYLAWNNKRPIGNTFCPCCLTLVDASKTTLECERHSPNAQTDDDSIMTGQAFFLWRRTLSPPQLCVRFSLSVPVPVITQVCNPQPL